MPSIMVDKAEQAFDQGHHRFRQIKQGKSKE